MTKRENHEAIASIMVLIGLVVCVVSVLFWHFGVPFEACFPSVYMAAFPMCAGFLWLSIESFKSKDAVKKKAIDAAGCGFLGLLLLEFIINYGSHKFLARDLHALTHIYAIPLVMIYLSGCVAYLISWIKAGTKKLYNTLAS